MNRLPRFSRTRTVCLASAILLLAQSAPPVVADGEATGAAASVATSDGFPELLVEQGRIRGQLVGQERDVEVYKGIPFASPPVGDRRWKPPQPPQPWAGVRDCTVFGYSCPQPVDPLANLLPIGSVGETSEDCLYLNVYRPTMRPQEPLPVMVWIHGGGYTTGSASQGLYDGAQFARDGVIFVSINYRLGVFGFLAHPQLTAESDLGVSGNYGILDQIEALRWVQNNIAAFGGDPERVTIFGESAGGGSVICLLVSPLAQGLFHRAIAQSAPLMKLRHLTRDSPEIPSAERFGQSLIAESGLGEDADVADMRQLSAEQLVSVTRASTSSDTLDRLRSGLLLPLAPVVDGAVIPEDPDTAMKAGRCNRVPVMIGNTRDEAELMMIAGGHGVPDDAEAYQHQAEVIFGDAAPQILAAYPPAAERRDHRQTLVRLMTDFVFGTQARRTANDYARLGQPTYRYVFSREIRVLVISAAFHGCEIPYLFGMEAMLVSDWDKQLAKDTRQYWINFATSGDPNGEGLTSWPIYQASADPVLELGDEIKVLQHYRQDGLDAVEEFQQR